MAKKCYNARMKGRALKKLNKCRTIEKIQSAILAAGYLPFEEGDLNGLSLMTIFKAKERHTARKKKDGAYVKLQSFTSPEGAENCDFIALEADEKLLRRDEDGKKFRPLYCKLFIKEIN